MKATILDTQTGQRHVIAGPSTYDFTDGNWSCDCNRAESGAELNGPTCLGCHRYIVVSASMEDPVQDCQTRLRDLNAGYPLKLLLRHIPAVELTALISPL